MFLVSILCNEKRIISSGSKCDSINKIDSLIQDVILKPYLYMGGPYDSTRQKYILERELIPEHKIFRDRFEEQVPVLKLDQYDSVYAGIIKFDTIKFTNNFQNAKIRVSYFSPSDKKISRTINIFQYAFDTVNCKWILNDSIMLVH